MVQTLATNEKNDIFLDSSGNIAVLTGAQAVAGACTTLSQAKLGEMILTNTQGIPYDQAIFIGTPNLKVWQSYLLAALQNIAGVIQVNNLEVTVEQNTLVYRATIQTIYGTTQIGS